MKKILAALAAWIGFFGVASASEISLGMRNVQVRDRVFAGYGQTDIERVFDVGPWRFFNTFEAQWARPVFGSYEMVAAFGIGNKEGRVEGLSSSLLLLDPRAGLRKRGRNRSGFTPYGEATVDIPVMRARFDGRSEGKSFWGAFPLLAVSAGVHYEIPSGPGGAPGASIEVGYTTPAPIGFSSAGSLNFGGLTYGAYLTWNLTGSRP